MSFCPCNSFRRFSDCCGPILAGQRPASTAEALMRSRYCAYAQKNVDYLIQTYAAKQRKKQKRSSIVRGMEDTNWVQLTIISIFEGRQQHQTGEVEFVAEYVKNGKKFALKERSLFIRENGVWRYVRGMKSKEK